MCTPSRSCSPCRRGASARAGRSSSRPARRPRRRSGPALSSPCRSTRSCCSGESEAPRRVSTVSVTNLRCTYRIQLTPELGFRRVREVVLPYARELGVSHLYLSPVLQARRGSLHGYDVVDPTRVSRELGGEEELRALCAATHAAGLGTILDVVPNHMATSEEETRFWRDPELRA